MTCCKGVALNLFLGAHKYRVRGVAGETELYYIQAISGPVTIIWYLRCLTRTILSYWRRRDSGGGLQVIKAEEAGSPVEQTGRRVLASLLQ